MEELKPLISAFPASGLPNSRLREKMETHYEKDAKEQTIGQYQPEASASSAYKSEMSQQEKENLFKEIYSNIRLFEKLVYKARNTLDKTD